MNFTYTTHGNPRGHYRYGAWEILFSSEGADINRIHSISGPKEENWEGMEEALLNQIQKNLSKLPGTI